MDFSKLVAKLDASAESRGLSANQQVVPAENQPMGSPSNLEESENNPPVNEPESNSNTPANAGSNKLGEEPSSSPKSVNADGGEKTEVDNEGGTTSDELFDENGNLRWDAGEKGSDNVPTGKEQDTITPATEGNPPLDTSSFEKSFLEKISKEAGKQFSGLSDVVSAIKDANPTYDTKLMKDLDEYVKSGGDPATYFQVASFDFDKISDQDMVANELRQQGILEDEDKIQDFISGRDEVELKLLANQARQKEKSRQEEQIRNAKKFQEERIKERNQAMLSTLEKMDSVGPFKLSAKHKNEMAKALTSQDPISTLFTVNGQPNHEAFVKAAIFSRYGDQMMNVASQMAKSQTLKQVVKDAGNAAPQGYSTGGKAPSAGSDALSEERQNFLNKMREKQGRSHLKF